MQIKKFTKVEYDFVAYATPRKAVVSISSNQYILGIGWRCFEEVITVIGEDSTAYITELRESIQGEWVDNRVIRKQYILPIGVHKSRLVRWLDSPQKTLF